MLSLLALALSAPTFAASEGPWMWGAGATLGTIVYPGRFPLKLPKEYDGLEGMVRGDAILGLHGVMYLNGDHRLGTHLDFGTARGFNSLSWTLEYERIFLRDSGIHLFGGGGLGFGSYSLSDEEIGTLRTPTYEVRAQAGALYKQKVTAEELSIFVKVPFNGNPTFTSPGGDKVDAEGGGNWLHVGIQATVYYGDFTSKKGKGGGKGGGNKSGSGNKSGGGNKGGGSKGGGSKGGGGGRSL